MPGRKPNLDKRIATLIADLKAALVAREQQRQAAETAARVDAAVAGIVKEVGLSTKSDGHIPIAYGAGSAGRGNRKPRSAASRAAQSRKMKAIWAAKKAAKAAAKKAHTGKRGKQAKTAAAPVAEAKA